MNKEEQWANEVLQSVEGLKRAEPSVELFAKIKDKLPTEKVTKIIPLRRLRWVAAVACLVVGLNIYVLENEIKTESVYSSTTENIDLFNSYVLYN